MRTRIHAVFVGVVVFAAALAACEPIEMMPPAPPPPPPPPVAVATATAEAPPPAPPPKPTLAELEKQTLASYAAAFNARDAKKLSEAYAPDGVWADPGPTGMVEIAGREAIEKGQAMLFAAFPDIKMASTRVFQKDNVVVAQWVSNGTHKGDFMGMKATEKPIGLMGATVFWFGDDGLIKKAHGYFDSATIAIQTGAQKGKARGIPAMPTGEPEWIVAKGSPDDEKTVSTIKAFYGFIEKNDDKGYLPLLAEDSVHTSVNMADDVTGPKAAKAEMDGLHKAFPDAKLVATSAWGFGNIGIAEAAMTGTFSGKGIPGIPGSAAKKAVTLHSLEVIELKGGKLSRGVTYQSNLEMMGQLGLLPQPKADKPAAGAKPAAPGAKPAASEKPSASPAKPAAAAPKDAAAASKPSAAQPAAKGAAPAAAKK